MELENVVKFSMLYHVHISSHFTEKHTKRPAEVKVNNIHWPPIDYRSSHFIIGSNQVGYVRQPLLNPFCLVPRHILLSMYLEINSKRILTDFTSQPDHISSVLLLSFKLDVTFPVTRNLTQSPWPLKADSSLVMALFKYRTENTNI